MRQRCEDARIRPGHAEGHVGMQGDPEIIEFLNEQLTAELTAINQYFLHAKLQEHHGWTRLAKYTRAESFDEMRHAERLTDRIVFLEALPNYQRLFHVRVGQTVTEMFQADRQVEVEAIDRLRRGIQVMRAKDDITSANIFEYILADEEEHIDYLDTQLQLIEKLGEPLYLAQQIEQPDPGSHTGAGPAQGSY
jgi:bacterioferritin